MVMKVMKPLRMITKRMINPLIEIKAIYTEFRCQLLAKWFDSIIRLQISFMKLSISILIGIP